MVSIGEIIFAVMVALQGLLFLIGLGFFIALIISGKKDDIDLDKSTKCASTALIIWGISNIFPVVGVFFAVFL